MIEIGTAINARTQSSQTMNPMERSASFSSSSSKSDSVEKPSTCSSPTKQSAFSAVVKVSKMQATFAERTATEMEEIVSWYKKYEGVERLKKENQQIQSMPHNAMIVVDNDDEENHDNTIQKENCDTAQQDNEQQKIQIDDEEFVTVKDYHTPTQKIRKSATPRTSEKKTNSLLASAVRSLSKARKIDEPPPIAIQVSSEDEDDISAMPSLSPLSNADNSTKKINAPCVLGDSGHRNSKEDIIREYRDEEEEVLAMLSPTGCAQSKAQTLIDTTDIYVDEEEELLELLLSPSSCSSKSVLSMNGARRSPVGQSDDSESCTSTGEEAQSQIKAADELIRNTQNMAEIILQLQQSSLLSTDGNCDDDNDDVNIYDTNDKFDDFSTSPTSSESISSMQYNLDARSTQEAASDHNASIASLKVKVPRRTTNSSFQERLFYRAIVPIFLSLVIKLVLKIINDWA